MELDEDYFSVAKERIANHVPNNMVVNVNNEAIKGKKSVKKLF